MIALFKNQQLPGIRHKAATDINELAGRPLVDIPCQWATRHVRLEIPIFWRLIDTRFTKYLWWQVYEPWQYAIYHDIARQGN